MISRSSFTEIPASNLSLTLERIFVVQSGREYDVKYRDRDNEGNYAVFRTLKGRGRLVLTEGRKETLDTGSLIIVLWDEVLRYYCDAECWDFLWFRFSADGKLPLPLSRTVSIPLSGDDENVIDQCMELTGMPYREAGALASSLAAMLIHRWAFSWIQSVSPRTAYQAKIDRVTEKMKSDLSRKLTSGDLAGLAGLSERQFRSVFKEVTGLSPRDFYQSLRMKSAADLLTLSHLSLGEIAVRLGYCDPFHFSRVFKEFHGLSPREYRRR